MKNLCPGRSGGWY